MFAIAELSFGFCGGVGGGVGTPCDEALQRMEQGLGLCIRFLAKKGLREEAAGLFGAEGRSRGQPEGSKTGQLLWTQQGRSEAQLASPRELSKKVLEKETFVLLVNRLV